MKIALNPKISIIVPVYNPGVFFEKCILSLINQTLKEIEIIFVLDCPTDGSDKLVEDYAQKDSRIKIIYNQSNIHAGFSRNKGMDLAVGEYIGFHDADDYSEPQMYDLLYNKAKENNYDSVRCNFKCIYPPKSGLDIEYYKYPEVTEDPLHKIEIYKKVCDNAVSCVVWSHIFKADFLKRYNLRFVDSNKITSEDALFFIEAYQHLNNLGIINDYLYYHIFHTTNTGKSYRHRSVRNRIAFFEGLNSFLEKNEIGQYQRFSYLSPYAARSLYSASRQAILEHSLKKGLSEIKQIRDNCLMMQFFNFLDEKENVKLRAKLKPTIRFFLFFIKK